MLKDALSRPFLVGTNHGSEHLIHVTTSSHVDPQVFQILFKEALVLSRVFDVVDLDAQHLLLESHQVRPVGSGCIVDFPARLLLSRLELVAPFLCQVLSSGAHIYDKRMMLAEAFGA